MKNLIIEGISVETALENAYNDLREAGKVDVAWEEYTNKIATICEEESGDTNGAVDMIENFLHQMGVEL